MRIDHLHVLYVRHPKSGATHKFGFKSTDSVERAGMEAARSIGVWEKDRLFLVRPKFRDDNLPTSRHERITTIPEFADCDILSFNTKEEPEAGVNMNDYT